MRFASFCALAGTALLAGHVVVGEDEAGLAGHELPDIQEPTKEGGEIGDLSIEIPAEETADEISPEVVDGLTLSQDELDALAGAETQTFQAEVSRMMKLIINSIYKNKEIFLRELISNASDALDKIRMKALTDGSISNDTLDLQVRIRADKGHKVLHIEDTGVGMTKEELMKNLGTIAKSGTADFMEQIESGNTAEASSLIGQFGVGFYSAFLVADKIVVTSKADGDDQHVWTSDSTSYSIIKDPRGNTLKRGTRISLYLKSDSEEYLEASTLSSLVATYSEYIDFPIYSWNQVERATEENDTAEDGDDDVEEDADDDDDDGEIEDANDTEEEEEEEKTELVWDYELMNPNKPIWSREPKEVEVEDYASFYKAFTKDTRDPLGHTHFKAEGEIRFKSIMYLPSKESFRNNQQEMMQKVSGRNVKLYVRRVFITDNLEDFMPRYLWFVKGLVDSDDLPLTVSREDLQAHKLMKVIRKKVVKKTLDMIKDVAESDEEKYADFTESFGTSIKLGIVEDGGNRGRLSHLLRFESSTSDGKLVSLKKYIDNMKEGQKTIYFLTAASVEECNESPFTEQLRKRDFEVLYMTDPMDEYALQHLPEYEGFHFTNVAKENLKFDDKTEENEARKAFYSDLESEFEATKQYLQEILGDKILNVVVSSRLEDSPAVLVARQFGWSGNMHRIMESQPESNRSPDMDFFASQKSILEINPRHPLIQKLKSMVESNEMNPATKDLSEILFDTAMIRSGYTIKNQLAFANRMERMLRLSVGVDVDAKIEALAEFPENPVVEEEESETEAETEEIDAEAEDDDEPSAEVLTSWTGTPGKEYDMEEAMEEAMEKLSDENPNWRNEEL